MTWWWLLILALRAAVPLDAHGGCAGELAALDRIRAEAFTAADPALLGQVYETNSPLRDIDARAITAYRARGARVVGAQMNIIQCEEVQRTSHVIRLDVVDALWPAVVVWDEGDASALPRDRPTRRLVTLRHTADGWRISESRPSAPTSDQEPRT